MAILAPKRPFGKAPSFERKQESGLEPRVVRVLRSVDEAGLRLGRPHLGGLLRRRRVLGGIDGVRHGVLHVLEEAHGCFLLVRSPDRSVVGWRRCYIDAWDMSVPMRLATCGYCCIRCVQPIEMSPHRPGGTPFEVTYSSTLSGPMIWFLPRPPMTRAYVSQSTPSMGAKPGSLGS